MSVADLKARLSDVPGIESLTMQLLGGRQVFGFDGLIAAVDPIATDQEIEDAIRETAARRAAYLAKVTTPLPDVGLMPAPITETKPMGTPAPGSFAASLKAMLDEAQSGLMKAQDAGRARVQQAVSKFSTAAAATAKVSESKAKEIEDAADSVLADLGQISNDLGTE